MSGIDQGATLASMVNERPAWSREFERRGLDYCCNGGTSFRDACVAAGLDPEVVAAELDAVAQPVTVAEWTTMDARELVDHLESTHHRYLWEELPRLSTLVAKIVDVHGERHPELLRVAEVYESVRGDLEPHLVKEERVLFPMVRELAGAAAAGSPAPSFHCGSLRNPISMMLREHDAVGDLLASLRMLTDQYRPPADGCATYALCFAGLAEMEADTHLHIHKENNLLFPMVVRLEAETGLGSAEVAQR